MVGEAGIGKSTLAHFINESMPSHAGHIRRKMPPPTGETIEFDESRRFVINLPPTHGGGGRDLHSFPCQLNCLSFGPCVPAIVNPLTFNPPHTSKILTYEYTCRTRLVLARGGMKLA